VWIENPGIIDRQCLKITRTHPANCLHKKPLAHRNGR
jgi:hypothetical protein